MSGMTFKIGGRHIGPGEQRTVDLPVARLYTHTELTMPVHVICGRRPGPTLFVSAALHGDELNGVEVIRRLLVHSTFKRLRGTLVAIPIVNVHGFLHRSRYLPDRRDLNRCFPGSERGSLAARIAWLFMEKIVARCTHGIDLHTGAIHRANLPQIRADLDDPETAALARAFGVPVVIDARLRDGSLRQAAAERAIPTLLYEAGEALRFDEVAIRGGVRGVLNVMRLLKMLPPSRSQRPPREPVAARATTWVRAPESGILHTHQRLGARVAVGEHLGSVASPFGNGEHAVISPCDGIIIGQTRLPLADEGDALFHLARFDRVEEVAAQVDAYHDALAPPEMLPMDTLPRES